jgi:hypothetical protein
MEHLHVSKEEEDDTSTLYEYGSMLRALAEPESRAYLWGHHGAGYLASDGLT